MKQIFIALGLTFCLAACCLNADETPEQIKYDKIIFKNDSTTLMTSRARLIAAIEMSIKNLDSLTDKQRNAVAILLIVSSEFEVLSNEDPIDLNYKKQIASFVNKVHPEIKIIPVSNITGSCSQARFNCDCERNYNDSIKFANNNQRALGVAMNCAARQAQSRVNTALILLQGCTPLLNVD